MPPQINEEVFRDIARRLPSTHRDVPETTNGIHWFLYGLVRLRRPGVVLEIGTCGGDATCHLVRAVIEAGHGKVIGYESNPKRRGITELKVKEACGKDAPFEMRDAFPIDGCEKVVADFVFLDLDPKTHYSKAYANLEMEKDSWLCAHDLTYKPDSAILQMFSEELKQSGDWEIVHIPQERGLIVARRI
jgi:predicted O-methyltransferase YrrM